MTVQQLFFGYFSVMILALSLVVITRRNLVHAVLWMLLMFVHIAGLYLFLNAEFFAVIQIIVYAGAILVMFLFVVMLLRLKEEQALPIFVRGLHGRLFVGLAILLVLVSMAAEATKGPMGQYSIDYIQRHSHLKVLGTVLFNDFVYPFLILGFILFVPMIGVVVLALKRRSHGPS
jgi:NADH-quinone oxidoreductase subunit J